MAEKIWYKSYDPGVPHTINPDQYSSLIELMEESFTRYKDKKCFVNFGSSITYHELDVLSQCFAGYLQSVLGLKKEDRIAFIMPNLLQYPLALFGALRAGLIVVNINPLLSSQDLHDILIDTQPSCVMVFSGFGNTLEAALINTDIKYIIYTEIGDLFPFFKRIIVNFAVTYIKKLVPNFHIVDAIPFRKTISLRYYDLFTKVKIDNTDVAFLQFSGARKDKKENCVMLTHRNMIANMLQMSVWLESFFRREYAGGMVNPFPFCRTISMMSSFAMMRLGFALIIITNPRDIPAFVKEIKQTPFSIIFGINALYNALLQNTEFTEFNLSNLKFCASGGMPVQKAVAEKWKTLTKCNILQAYGLVEASPIVSFTPITAREFSGSVGLPLPSTDVKIVDDNGNEVPIGELGELWVKGPQVMKGYWNDPEKTKQVLTADGWLKTDDIVKMDANGYLYIFDRKEDVIYIDDKRVYSIKIEGILVSIPGVSEAGVVGVRDKNGKMLIKAYVVKNVPELKRQDIFKVCSEKLEKHEVPYSIEFRKALPRTIVGYLLRRALRVDAEKELKGMDYNG